MIVRYAGVPEVVIDPDESIEGWIPTADGAFVVGEPQGAPGWFPANDNPRDKATFDIAVTVPAGVTAMANGVLAGRTRDGQHHLVWREDDPMATYLATATLGRFTLTRRGSAAIPVYVAVDPTQAADARPGRWRGCRTSCASSAGSSARTRSTPSGAIVDDAPDVGYALESADQAELRPARPTRRRSCTSWRTSGSATRSRCASGPTSGSTRASPTWSEWLWGEHHGGPTAQERFDELYARPRRRRSGTRRRPPAAAAEPVQRLGLRPRRDDAAGAPRQGRRRRPSSASCATGTPRTATATSPRPTSSALAERDSHRNLGRFFYIWLYRDGRVGTADPSATQRPAALASRPHHRR